MEITHDYFQRDLGPHVVCNNNNERVSFQCSNHCSSGAASRRGSRPKRRDPVISEDLLCRTSWVDAWVAYRQICRGKATGNTCALRIRAYLQTRLFSLGCFIQKHCGKVLFIGLLLLSLCCLGLKTASIETNVEKLWVEEGGRLEKEIQYTEKVLGKGTGSTNEIIIQLPKDGSNLLSVESFLLHHKILTEVTQITVSLFDTDWRFKDLCYRPSFPSTDDRLGDQILDKLVPCMTITPLDCFWEGSKILGPDSPVFIPGQPPVKWSNLNPQEMIEHMRVFQLFAADHMQEVMNRAGVTTAYMERPCLDPTDPECPESAKNKKTLQPPDIGVELTGGCTGFSEKFMQWPEELIVGGVQKNKSGYITKAEGLQSIALLMGEQNMYDYHRDTKKTMNLKNGWTVEKASLVLQKWQREFTKKVNKLVDERQEKNITSSQDLVYSFSTTSMIDLLQRFSEVSYVRVAIGYIIMVVYACISLLKWTDAVQSQSGIGIAGVLLVALSCAGGLGICAVFGLSFNASTTQIIPFLALGLGVDDMFLLAHCFAENWEKQEILYADQTGETLKRTGVAILLTSLSNMVAFFMAAIIPIPALRVFSLQTAILVLFNLLANLIIFPAIVSLDMIRKEDRRVDVFCCFLGSSNDKVVEIQPQQEVCMTREESPPPPYTSTDFRNFTASSYFNTAMQPSVTHTDANGSHPVTTLANTDPEAAHPGNRNNMISPSASLPSLHTSSTHCLASQRGSISLQDRCAQTHRECCSWSLTWFAKNWYGPFLERTPVKIFVVLGFALMLVFGIIGVVRVKDGLDLTDVIPRNTKEYSFLDAQAKYFGFYNMYAATKEDFNYAEEQQLLYRYHQSFQRVHKIIKKEDGTMPDFWLQLFKNWLLEIQEAFDRDHKQGCIVEGKWFRNASDDGILGYKLMIQTGDTDNPHDTKRILSGRLVNNDGIIYPKAFYNFITAWTSNDALAYSACDAAFFPEPKQWIHDPSDYNLIIPRSQQIRYAQTLYYLNDMGDTQEVTDTIRKIRVICETFEEKGLPNFPRGIPFTFWEQYINLRFYLMLAMICVLGGIFLVLTMVLMNPWVAIIVVFVLSMMVVSLFGFMGLVGIKLSAVPAVILIVSTGIGVEFTVHITLGFLTSIGSRNKRMKMTLEQMFTPVIHGAMSTLLGVLMLSIAEFDFIVRYFFVVLTALIVLGLMHGLVLLPVLLSILGPSGEIIPADNSDRISPPTPEPSPVLVRPVRSVSRRVYPRIPSDCNLSTITEEPTQYSSQEVIVTPSVIVQPEVIVETTLPGQATFSTNSSSSRNSSPSSSNESTPPMRRHATTTVRATAKVKVEVHHPLQGAADHEYKSRRRKQKDVEVFEDPESDGSVKSSSC